MKMYYFIGIKGSGMSSLAQIMHELGYQVSGSDVGTRFFTQIGLEKMGIPYDPKRKYQGLNGKDLGQPMCPSCIKSV